MSVPSSRPSLQQRPPPAGTNPSRVIVLLLSALLNKTSANEGWRWGGGGGAAGPTWIQQVAGQEEMRSVWELKPINSFKLFTPPLAPHVPRTPH